MAKKHSLSTISSLFPLLSPILILLGILLSAAQSHALGDGDIYCLYQKKDFQGESICGTNDLNQLVPLSEDDDN